MKKILAFSLIELTISLIVISVIAASFAPLISKKLCSSKVSIGQTNVLNCSKKFGSKCVHCSKTECLLCFNFLSCAENEYIDMSDCTCKSCSLPNCASCTKEYCKACKEGYGYNSSTHTCAPCSAPYYSLGGASPCLRCDSGYDYQDEDKKGSCKFCDASNGLMPNSDRKSCVQKTCPRGYYRSGVNCVLCEGNTIQNVSDQYTGTTCPNSCGAYETSNSTHTECNCIEGYTKVGSSCVSTSCPSGYWDGTKCVYCSSIGVANGVCTSCNSGGCTGISCNSGYHKVGTSCVRNDVVCSGAQYRDPSTNTCRNCSEGCNSCTNESNCTACKDGYILNGGTCNKKAACSPQMITVNGLKVTRFNMGDDYSGCPRETLMEIDSSIKFVATGNTCASASEKCCWYGSNTANPCHDASGGIYSGCGRTVCNYAGAKAVCEAAGLRLPTESSMVEWWKYSTKDSGLMLCHFNAYNSADISNCNSNDKCSGNAGTGYCEAAKVWTATDTRVYKAQGKWNDNKSADSWKAENTKALQPRSVRCVQ